ncbi:MAG TPA: alpha/beta hydrolase [Beijerinckiaceae bacterium]|jgi:pimeloyl-ACP methyl ester carboxylesterase
MSAAAAAATACPLAANEVLGASPPRVVDGPTHDPGPPWAGVGPDRLRRVEDVAVDDGTVLPLYELGLSAGPTVLFVHGCGFAAASYRAHLEHVGRSCRVFAIDLRGHGSSRLAAPDRPAGLALERLALDLVPVIDRVTRRGGPPHIVAHSLGAVLALRLAAMDVCAIRTLTLFEPALLPQTSSKGRQRAVDQLTRMALRARAQSSRYGAPETLAEHLRAIPTYAELDPGILLGHARAVLRPTGQGDFERRCSPAFEAQILDFLREDDEWPDLSRVRQPCAVVAGVTRSPRPLWMSDLAPEVAAALPAGTSDSVTGGGHLMLLAEPAQAAVVVRRVVGQSLDPLPRARFARASKCVGSPRGRGLQDERAAPGRPASRSGR